MVFNRLTLLQELEQTQMVMPLVGDKRGVYRSLEEAKKGQANAAQERDDLKRSVCSP